jgi:phytoene synthase
MPVRPELSATRALACLYCPPRQRALLEALCALEREIGASLAPGLDHQVAHTRLVWWREECVRCEHGEPVHPLTRELAGLCGSTGALAGLTGFVDTAVWDLAAATFQTRRELQAYCERWSAAMIEPWARWAAPALEPAQVRGLGCDLRETELLLALAAEARAGRLRLPLAELEHARVEPEELAQPPWRPALAGLVRERHGQLRAALSAGIAALPASARAALRGMAVWAAIAAAQSRRAQAMLPQANITGESRAPLDGWRAWRAARRALAGGGPT